MLSCRHTKQTNKNVADTTFKLTVILFTNIVPKGVPAPFLWHPPLDPACPPPFLKSLFPLLFLFHPLLRYFRQFPLPSYNPSCTYPTHQTFLHINNKFKQISKRMISPVQLPLSIKNHSLQIYPYNLTNISGYLNLWDIFRVIFRQLRMGHVYKYETVLWTLEKLKKNKAIFLLQNDQFFT